MGVPQDIIAAIASSSVVSALISGGFGAYQIRKKAQLDEQQAASNARRDYEYEARKRLYTVCEPLIFQLIESGQVATKRIRIISTWANTNSLDKALLNAYFFNATVYRLFVPVAIASEFERQLTLVDLAVDSRINSAHKLSRMLYQSFNAVDEVGRAAPKVDYQPAEQDEVLVAGDLAGASDAMILEENGARHLMSFGQYEALFAKEQRPNSSQPVDEGNRKKLLAPVRRLFEDFSPSGKPALWRTLLVQVLIYQALYALGSLRSDVPTTTLRPTPPGQGFRERFRWEPKSQQGDRSATSLFGQFDAAWEYVTSRVEASEFDEWQ